MREPTELATEKIRTNLRDQHNTKILTAHALSSYVAYTGSSTESNTSTIQTRTFSFTKHCKRAFVRPVHAGNVQWHSRNLPYVQLVHMAVQQAIHHVINRAWGRPITALSCRQPATATPPRTAGD